MTGAENPVTILPVSVAAIFDAPNAAYLLHSYAEECLIPDAQPQRAVYEAMEKTDLLRCFGAYASGPEIDTASPYGLLIGFISVATPIMPHCGKRIATVESLFVDPNYRHSGAGNYLLDEAERYAARMKCLALTCAARVGSAFDKVLSRRTGYALTHVQHTRWLA